MKPADAAFPGRTRIAGRWQLGYLAFAGLMLGAPLLAMQVSDEVAWGPEDFAAMAAMLAALGLMLEAAGRLAPTVRMRAVVMGAAVLAFLLLWAELAVGLFD
ncbi:hypothetical protein WAB17_03460 [Parerythrobacter aurantius]|uniref:hypothetical protein n=1 Tax=Parerythrobacter aurantius TaxID=3127706 RepID=UPI003243102E